MILTDGPFRAWTLELLRLVRLRLVLRLTPLEAIIATIITIILTGDIIIDHIHHTIDLHTIAPHIIDHVLAITVNQNFLAS